MVRWKSEGRSTLRKRGAARVEGGVGAGGCHRRKGMSPVLM
jgi:hypothetical protein